MAQDTLARTFIQALRALETGRGADEIAALYAPEAPVGNVVVGGRFAGPEGAREFWTRYRDAFASVESRFSHVFETPEGAALEWTSEGELTNGEPFVYEGVTILDFDGGRLVGSRAYFNPRDLTAHAS